MIIHYSPFFFWTNDAAETSFALLQRKVIIYLNKHKYIWYIYYILKTINMNNEYCYNIFISAIYRFGRKFAMVFCAVTSAIICIIQSFSVNYQMFLILELLSSIVSSGIYTVTFVLGKNIFNRYLDI